MAWFTGLHIKRGIEGASCLTAPEVILKGRAVQSKGSLRPVMPASDSACQAMEPTLLIIACSVRTFFVNAFGKIAQAGSTWNQLPRVTHTHTHT